jgi:hypothetical protein
VISDWHGAVGVDISAEAGLRAHAWLPDRPVTRAQVSHFFFVQHSSRLVALLGRDRPVVQVCSGVLEVGRGAADLKVVASQIFLLRLVKHRTNLARVPLEVELQVGLGQVVALDFKQAFGALAGQLEVVGLDGSNEVFIWRHNGGFRVLVGEQPLIRRDEAWAQSFSELHRRLLRLHFSYLLLPRLPSVCGA